MLCAAMSVDLPERSNIDQIRDFIEMWTAGYQT
jgi:hypothetical protein